ncbi:MAG: two-component system response regulator [Verrucomicrobia bacterium 61-8]|nr:response regulator [Verrucomicrobiota bacterium]OJV04598.1 MAG: two-component system response regulator [Verrucomicrobia bacterium 61-8]
MKIALIDDDEVFRETLARSLRRRHHEVIAADGGHSVEECRAFQPDAILLDLKMPGDTGLSLIPRLKAAAPSAKIVMLTGYGSIATAMEAVKLGCADYLMKPADSDQIEAALEGRPKSPEVDVPTLDRVEWEHLQRILADCGNNISQAARLLGIDRRSLQRKLAKYPPAR